ncbi:hypothetical protein PPERSA_12708 [Pseudocohnilembus persalinus]|uniref:Galactose oxidase/kelch, beta-propeller n=1 Tax=Pseudocohnilembus persalinus TaxID=266149 RepID=A0A0V0QU59_PSEPJ|nr:hypothetical protein PPERSA_12708 [Pseudocohnilembus persalinus]|eukprot:KRX05530.1 hypothetical protein PPERSA_12708 [Pseudocohnilembus persalinus]
MNEVTLKQNSRNPDKRAGSSFFNIDQSKYVLIGGGNRSEEYEDIWQLEITKNENIQSQKQKFYEANWEKIKQKEQNYSKRTGQSSCKTEDKIYIYGGQNFHINKHFDDFFEVDLQQKQIQPVQIQNIYGPKDHYNTPSSRNSSAMTYDHINKQIYLLGGADEQEPLNDLFTFNTENKVWKRVDIQNQEMLKSLEMHTLHFYTSNRDLSQSFKNKKKKKNNQKNKEKLIDLNIGGLGVQSQKQNQQIQEQNNEDSSEQIAKQIKKVNLEFDEKNAKFEEAETNNNNNEQEDIEKEIQEQEEKFDEEAMKQIQRFEDQEIEIQKIEKQQQQQNLNKKESNSSENEEKKQQEEKQENKQYNYLICIGGRSQNEILDQILALDLETKTWFKLKDLPTPLCAHASTLIQKRDEIWIFGGTDGSQFFDNLYILNLANNKFYQIDIQQQIQHVSSQQKLYFPPKMAASISYDEKNEQVLIFGGSTYEDESSQIISFDTTKINSQLNSKKI